MQLAGRLFDKFGIRWLAITGCGLLAAATFLFSRLSGDASLGIIIPPLVLMGAGMGLCMMPLNTHVMKSAPLHLATRVSSLTSAMQQVITSLAVAGMTTSLTRSVGKHLQSGGPDHTTAWMYAYSHAFSIIMFIAVFGVILGFFIRKTEPSQG